MVFKICCEKTDRHTEKWIIYRRTDSRLFSLGKKEWLIDIQIDNNEIKTMISITI